AKVPPVPVLGLVPATVPPAPRVPAPAVPAPLRGPGPASVPGRPPVPAPPLEPGRPPVRLVPTPRAPGPPAAAALGPGPAGVAGPPPDSASAGVARGSAPAEVAPVSGLPRPACPGGGCGPGPARRSLPGWARKRARAAAPGPA